MVLLKQTIKNRATVIDTNVWKKCSFVNSSFECNAQKMDAWINTD